MKELVVLLMIGGIVAAVVLLRRGGGRGRGPSAIDLGKPLAYTFLQRFGYVFPDAPHTPPQVAVERWAQLEQQKIVTGQFDLSLVRNYQGLEVRYRQTSAHSVQGNMRSNSWSETWSTPPLPLTAPLHIVHRELMGPRRNQLPTSWAPAFPQTVMIGDPQLDHLFAVFSPAPQPRVQAILTNPRLRAALLSLAHVDLRATPDGLFFSDPSQMNAVARLRAAAQSVVELQRPGKHFEWGAPTHEAVADIFLGISSLAR